MRHGAAATLLGTLAPVSVALKFGFLGVLYLFLLWVSRSALRDLRASRPAPARLDEAATGFHSATQSPLHTARDARLVVERAPGHTPGMIYDIGEGAVLGRGEAAEIRLDDPYASSRHAQLVMQAGVVVLEDLGSTNGTYLNEERLAGPAPLHSGDRVRIGDSEFTYEEGAMIRVAEHVARTDTGRQRATNEDAHLERAPVFVVADGMGGAQAGEVASQLAVAHFAGGLPGGDGDADARERLLQAARDANAEIHALSEADARRAGMGTTLTAAYVGSSEVFIAQVGDSRAYRWRDGALERITEDHSLVEELLRQGRLTEEEAEEHPQRSIITRALGPEPDVEIDTFAVGAARGDVYLLCSDGLTSMVGEGAIADVLAGAPDLASAADELVAQALAAGGRDNVTVVLFRIEEVGGDADGASTQELRTVAGPPTEELGLAAPSLAAATAPAEPVARRPRGRSGVRPVRARRLPRGHAPPSRRRRRRLWIGGGIVAVLAVLVIAGVLAAQAVYFIGADGEGQVAIYNGLPYTLPGGVRLYTQFYVSGVTVAELSKLEQGRLFDNELRSQASATRLVSQLELGRIAGQ